VALAGTAVCAAAFMLLLPRARSQAPGTVALRPLATLRVMLGNGPLRRTLYLTTSVALAVAALPVAAVGFAAVTGSEAAAAGTLTAAYGAGGLGASVLLMVRPLRTDADRSMTWFAASVAAMLALTLVSTTLWMALVLYAVVGACNSVFFATTLAARSEFAPDTARAQIFVWVGALKIASGAAGTALAGALIGPGVLLPVAVAAAVAGLAAALSQLERRRA
jgi:predicted MFS family arabinose efflux permease